MPAGNRSFSVGTLWILALNGPGAKPGNGFAISSCGEYWLKLENGHVSGSIHGRRDEIKKMPFEELKNRLLYPAFRESFSGELTAGQRFLHSFGQRFEFILEPLSTGWEIIIREAGNNENLARLTPPLHFSPNPRYIEGQQLIENPAHFPNCHSEPFKENPRKFIFSREVGKTIQGPESKLPVTEEDVKAVESFGRGLFFIKEYQLGIKEDGCPEIVRLKFFVQLEGGYQ